MRSRKIEIESIRQRILAQMPFANRTGSITCFAGHMRPSPSACRQYVCAGNVFQLAVFGVAAKRCANVVNFVAWRILAREQTGT